MMINVKVFWFMMLYSVALGYQRFGGPCCLHLLCTFSWRWR